MGSEGTGPGEGPAAPRLRETIRRHGPITFASFMEVALYDPEVGFYARPPIGWGGAYATSPHVSPRFGVLLARQVAATWVALGRPSPFGLVEVGGGDGTLACQLLAALPSEVAAATRFVGVERSPGARHAHAERGLAAVDAIAEAGAALGAGVDAAVVLANEVVDNLPFHRIVGTSDGPRELRVGVAADGGFESTPGPLSPGIPPGMIPPLRPGREAIVRPAAPELVDAALTLAPRVSLLLIDYASPATGALVHGYRGGRVIADVLSAPGSADITAPADLDALVRHARAAGARAWGPITQRDLLLDAGFREEDAADRARQVDALSARRGTEAVRRFAARQRASLLVDPAGLGAHRALWIGTAGLPRPGIRRPGRSRMAAAKEGAWSGRD